MNLDLLDKTPLLLKFWLDGIPDQETEWKPAPDRFSIAEVLAHLAHSEQYCYGVRIRKWLAEERPQLDPYDTDAMVAAGAYSGRPASESLAEFTKWRSENLSQVRAMPPDILGRTAVHQGVGPLSLEELLSECGIHELGHIRQIAELLRALRYYPHLGPFQREYRVSP
jgi:hypothetical protein